ncbi:MAG: cation transporter [Yaniella sp.]|uniref:cation transporter n=1 Tax=Yaniella sp. TaxID=2773929 RepID=UPI00264881B5|nr:cation transporter [Yaniella sp.]MDN5731393.1 cation transporter [Yaniella sp.]MDN5815308.1 cation transporter [Yaniella sp.]MDN5817948.1 cation transporter [Yaniella sp.]MDN5838211.1 cation transporter [Yaniella sp.]MDN5912146.1 cation transporter [Yaniella sp.]
MNSKPARHTNYFGQHDLPQEQQDALARAVRLEWISTVIRIFTVALIFSLAGSSQAMKASWIEDGLAFIPPIAFLIAVRYISRRPTPRHPYGFHRAIGVGHLVAAVALLTFGLYLFVESAMGLVTLEHPPIGMLEIFGVSVWAGWPMAVASVLVAIPSVILGRMKIKLAPVLHNKMLYADADMNKADWMTGLATGGGLLLVGAGFWWADATAAVIISIGIIRDGVRNLRGSLAGLIDARITTTDDNTPHPLLTELQEVLEEYDWVAEAGVRARDQGQVFHTEAFVVPRGQTLATLDELEEAREYCSDLDWKLHDLVIIPVSVLPEGFLFRDDDDANEE